MYRCGMSNKPLVIIKLAICTEAWILCMEYFDRQMVV